MLSMNWQDRLGPARIGVEGTGTDWQEWSGEHMRGEAREAMDRNR